MLNAKTKELIAMSLIKLGDIRQELAEALSVTTYMGGDPSLMCAADAIAVFAELAPAAGA